MTTETEKQKNQRETYSKIELICSVVSRQFTNDDVVFGGLGNAFLAISVAKILHAPYAIVQTEAGYIDFEPVSAFIGPGDNLAGTNASIHQGIFKTFCDLQSGSTDVSCLGAAQIDKYGNVNNSFISPDVRMNGSGGGGDIASSSGKTIYLAEFSARLFKEKVDFITNPGFLNGGENARANAGLLGGGPYCLVTDSGIFKFDPLSKEMYLAEVFPWQDEHSIEQLKSNIPWDLNVADNLKTIDPPTATEIRTINLLDSAEFYTCESQMERPIFKVILSGRNNLEGYKEIADLELKKIESLKAETY